MPSCLADLLVLGEGDAADRLDLAQPERAVGAGAGEDDADRARLLVLRQRAEEVVDRQVRAARLAARRELQEALRDRHVARSGGMT